MSPLGAIAGSLQDNRAYLPVVRDAQLLARPWVPPGGPR